MKSIRKYVILVMSGLFSSIVSAQLPDGVSATQSFLDVITKNYKAENSFGFDPNTVSTMAKIPIRAHIIMNIKGTAGISTNNIYTSLGLANSFFKYAGIQFFIDSVDYVNDYNYSFIKYNNLRKELLNRYMVNSRINLFLADSLQFGNNRCYGFTYFPDVSDSNIIYLDKKYITGNYLTTMLGHFMGLLSTHETMGGRELASEKNCSSAGDYICDTYADPDLFNNVIDSCKYIGSMRDDNGQYYVPSVANIMSNSRINANAFLHRYNTGGYTSISTSTGITLAADLAGLRRLCILSFDINPKGLIFSFKPNSSYQISFLLNI